MLLVFNTKHILDLSSVWTLLGKTQAAVERIMTLSLIEPEPKVILIESPKVNVEELHCLAENIYFEARNQSFAGRMAVALVTINRSKHAEFPGSICEVVRQRDANTCQFSWVCNKKLQISELGKWKESYDMAHMILVDRRDNLLDFTEGATHFHANYVKPPWATWSKMKRVAVIDNHIFYKKMD